MIAHTNAQRKQQMYVLPGQQAPYTQDGEEAVLGAMLTAPQTVRKVRSIIKPEDFYILRHTYICEALYRIDERGEKPDFVTVQEELRSMNRLNDVGGPAYLLTLVNNTPTSVHAEMYARLVERAAIRRRLLSAADEVKALALNEDLPVEKVVAESQRRLTSVKTPNATRIQRVQDAVQAHFERTKERKENGTTLPGVPSTIRALSKIIGGYQAGKLIVTAGRPGMGKSSHIYSEIRYACEDLGCIVLLESLEVSASEVIDNLCSVMIGIPVLKIRSGDLNDEQWEEYVSAVNRIDQWKLFINDSVSSTPLTVRADAMFINEAFGLDMVIVDYLQLLHSDDTRINQTRAQEVGSFARGLKELAKELDKPVLAAAQLNRAVESRQDKRPTLADLRESGDIEQSADVVIGIHREDYYEEPDKRDKFSHTEFIVLKNRDGETDVAHAGFYGEYKRFVTAQYSEEYGTWQYSMK